MVNVSTLWFDAGWKRSDAYMLHSSQGFRCIWCEVILSHVCVFSSVATDALVLKNRVISTHSAYEIYFVLDQFHVDMLHIEQHENMKYPVF